MTGLLPRERGEYQRRRDADIAILSKLINLLMRHIVFSNVDPSVAEMSWNGAEQLLQAAKDHGITVCFANPGPFECMILQK